MTTPPPTWEDVAWMREQWERPRSCSRACAVWTMPTAPSTRASTAISVSNHGGNNLDGTPASIRDGLPDRQAVGDQVEVLLDGGVRRGSDVVKAVALGARAVIIGRAYLWGLAANGQAGVENVLDVLRGGIDSALLGLGLSSIDELDPEQLLIPEGFHRYLGVPSATKGGRGLSRPSSPQ